MMSAAEKQALLGGSGKDGTGYYVGNTKGMAKYGIPALKMQDASSGFRPTDPDEAGTTTQWPCMLAVAATWDEDLISRFASALGKEFRGKGANVVLGPGVNVHRVARGGRNFEYLSGEDPYLGARLARTYIHAIQREGIMAVVKHFAFNEQETHRDSQSSEVDERTAWELYYPPFEAAVEAGVGAVMCSYNRVNGTYACENDALLRRDLRSRMGFQGFVMSDWGAAHSTSSLERGLDMELPSPQWLTHDRLGGSEDVGRAVDEAAVRILTSIFRLRLDAWPSCEPPCLEERRTVTRSEEHLKLARDIAVASVVLLKNDNGVLPLRTGRRGVRKIAVLGPGADARDVSDAWAGSAYAGGGSGHVVAPSVVTPLMGIRERALAVGMEVSHYGGTNFSKCRELAMSVDVVVVVGVALSSEGKDREELSLADAADDLIFAVAGLKPTVVVLQTPGATLTPWRHRVQAIANMFHGGEQAGAAWAAALFGDAAPAGKLPVGFPAAARDAREPGWGAEVRYDEGLFTSYRSPEFEFAFPFGHGLSYTSFAYGRPQQVTTGCTEAACVSLSVRNVGACFGAEVVQAYVRFTQAEREPRLVLRGFHKTRVLDIGEVEDVTFGFTRRDISLYHEAGGWLQQSEVQVHLGASSEDIRQVITVQIHVVKW